MLDDRKIKVLHAIINSHLSTAEPIGSRTISKDYNLGVSAATIRNEMSDLEDKGYLIKPHSSAGRVPSDKAYRLYVDEIMKFDEVEQVENRGVKETIYKDGERLEDIIKNSVKLLSNLTNYTALVMTPEIKKLKLKYIQLLNMDNNRVMLVLLNSSGVVRNSIFTIKGEFDPNSLIIISNYLNERFKDSTVDEILDKINSESIFDNNELKHLLNYILPIIVKFLEDMSDKYIYMDGITNILNFPEYKDLDKAKNFIDFVKNEELLMDIFTNIENDKNLNIIIGNENNYDEMKGCSLITANYYFENNSMGKIGIIGPTRMDYMYLIDTLDNLSRSMSEVLTMMLR